MKKFLTLIASVFMAVGAFAQEMEVDLPIESAEQWSAGWACTVTLENGIITATNGSGEKDFGAAAIWLGDVDWSEYGSLTVVMESCTGGWGQVVVNGVTNGGLASTGLKQSGTQYTVSCDLSNITEHIKQVCIQSSPGSVYKFSRVYLTRKVEYEAPVELATDQYGNCYATEFNGLSDYAKIVYTYETTGEAVKNDDSGASIVGWGTGNIHSCDGKVDLGNVNVQGIGEYSITFLLKDIKAALNSGPSQYNTYGLNWYFYPQGKSTTTFKKIEAYQVSGFEGEGFRAINTPEAIETNDAGVASYVTKYPLNFASVEGLTAYVATEATNSTVKLEKVTEVPGETAIVVKGDANTTYYVLGIASADAPKTNLLKAGLWGVTDDDNIYALNSDGCFQKVAGGVTVPTGKAFIDLGTKAAKSVLTLNFGDATAINAIQTVNTANANAFNIAGQRVNSDAKGIVIVNGRKFINK